MEYCAKGDLYNRIQENKKNKMMFPEKEVLRIFYGVMNAVKVLHDQLKTVHRDLCSQNIMFDANDIPKLIDFGSGRIIQEGRIATTYTLAHLTHYPPETEDQNFKYSS